jgi:vacuolar-type H+-ATPase subunit H
MDNIERFEQADFAGVPAGISALNKIRSAVKSIPPPKEAAKAIAKAAPSVAKAVVAQAPAVASNMVKAAENKVVSTASSAVKAVESINPKEIVKNAINELRDGLKGAYKKGVDEAKEAFTSVFRAVRDHVKNVLKVIRDFAEREFSAIIEETKKIFGAMKEEAVVVFNKAKEVGVAAYNKVKEVAETEFKQVQTLVKSQFPDLDFSKGPGAVMAMGALSAVGKITSTAEAMAGYVLQNNAVKPVIHTYAPPLVALSGISAMVLVSTFRPLMILGELVAGLVGWTILLMFMYVAVCTWVVSAGPTDDIAKAVGSWGVFTMGAPSIVTKTTFINCI